MSADLSLEKGIATGSSTPNVGDTVTFTLTVINAGSDTATNVSVSDVVPSGFSGITAIDNGGVNTSGTIDWTLASIASGDSLTLSYVVTVEASGDYINTAEITGSDQYDPDLSLIHI